MWIRRGIGPTWFIIGAALIGAIAVPINLYYNFRLTTSPFTMPYALHSRQYMRVPQFFWQGLAPAKAIQHPHLAWFYTVHEPAEVQVQTGSLRNFLLGMWLKWKLLAGSFLNPPVLSVLLFSALLAWRQKRAWLAWLAIVALPLVQMSITPWMREHYMAPAVAAWIAILGIGARMIWRWKPGGVRIGPLLLTVILAAHLYLSCDWAIAMNRQGAQTSGTARAKFIEMLKQEPGEDLVLVDCPPDEPGDPPGYRSVDDWVYNDADIDHSPVIFAHWMSDAQNAEIMNHYPQRHVWYVRLVPGGTSVRRMR
jgi:hypothetical protein